MSWNTVLVNYVLPCVLSVLASYITTRITFNEKIKSITYDERKILYAEFLDLLLKIKDEPQIIFNYDKVILPLNSLRVKMNLFASNNIINVIENLWVEIKSRFDKYSELFSGPIYEQHRENLIEYEGKTELDLQNEVELYIEKNAFDDQYIKDTLCKIIAIMREELKTNSYAEKEGI